jgi:hypothetical protein
MGPCAPWLLMRADLPQNALITRGAAVFGLSTVGRVSLGALRMPEDRANP